MKKIYIAMALIAAAALTSCQREESFGGGTLGPDALAFRVTGTAATRAGASNFISSQSITLGSFDGGPELILDETVTRLDANVAPGTKGTPAYTENIGSLYGSFAGAAYKNGTSVMPDDPSDPFVYDGKKLWVRANAIEPTQPEESINYYMRMPVAMTGVTNVQYETPAAGKISFTFESPATASAQQDILFAARPLTTEQWKDYGRENGVPILFHHALTGIKFRVGNDDSELSEDGMDINITKVEFAGLYKNGTCVVTPRDEKNGETAMDYKDNKTGDYSSSSDGVVAWTPTGSRPTDFVFSQEFGEYSKGTADYSGSGLPTAFTEAGATNNLNDNNASMTFWFIPQEMDDAVKLRVTYTVKVNGATEERNFTINFGKLLNAQYTANLQAQAEEGTTVSASKVTWKAGELRTYTLRIDDVNVSVTDKFTATSKTDVAITNTGNTAAYIRAAIIGQWIDKDGQPIFGYTDYVGGMPAPVAIPSWYEDFMRGDAEGGMYFGEFKGLAGYDSDYSGKWVRGADGYFYYPDPVPAGASIKSGTASASLINDPLFTEYLVDTDHIPEVKVAGELRPATLFIEVAAQAIKAPKTDDGTGYVPYATAWEDAVTAAQSAPKVPTE